MARDLDIRCRKCGELILLDETLAAPFIAKIQQDAETSIKQAREEAAAKVFAVESLQAALASKEVELLAQEAAINTQVNQTLAIERNKIASAERENLLKELSPQIEAERIRSEALQKKLEQSRQAELLLRQEKESIDERANNLELEIARKIDEQRKNIYEQARMDTSKAAETKIKEAENALSELQEKLDAKETLANALSADLAAREQELTEKESSVQTLITHAIATEREKIVAVERENLLRELSPQIDAEREKSKALEDKLDTARRAELELRQQRDAIDDRAKSLELEIARKIDEQREAIHERAYKEAEDSSRLKIAERDKTISDMQTKLEEAQRKATQGSQQLQGEVLELDFESTLRQVFPQDTIEPVKTGTRGGDILQRVLGQMSRPVATIFWETKRAQSWGGDWATKAKKDAAEAKAEVALIVSEALPKGIQGFGSHEGVWCVTPGYAVMLGLAIRQGVISTAEARQVAQGRESKKDRLYDYMVGPEFRATVEGIALPFRELYDELATEKRSTISRWKRQEKRLERVLANIASLQGDLQGIAGNEMLELPGFELEAAGSALLE